MRSFAKSNRFGIANEEAFHYFLAMERRRSQRSGRCFLLLVAKLKESSETRIDSTGAFRLFSALQLTLRESDVIGWYREDRILGALLNQPSADVQMDVARIVHERVSKAFYEHLGSDIARRLQIRVYEFRPRRGTSAEKPTGLGNRDIVDPLAQ